MLKRQDLRIEWKQKAQKEAEKAERHRKVAQAAVRAQAALECTQETEEAVGGIGVVEELEDESVRPTEVTVQDIERDTGLQASTRPSGESLKRRQAWLW